MKTRNIMLISIIVMVFLCGAAFFPNIGRSEEKQQKFGYVDLVKVFDSYAKTKESEKSLETSEKAKLEQRKKLVDEIRKLKDELELLTDNVKQEKQTQIDVKIKSLQDFDTSSRDELTKQRDDMLRDLLKHIDTTISGYAKKEGYTFIFNSRFLIYGDTSIDLTDKIIELVNK